MSICECRGIHKECRDGSRVESDIYEFNIVHMYCNHNEIQQSFSIYTLNLLYTDYLYTVVHCFESIVTSLVTSSSLPYFYYTVFLNKVGWIGHTLDHQSQYHAS